MEKFITYLEFIIETEYILEAEKIAEKVVENWENKPDDLKITVRETS